MSDQSAVVHAPHFDPETFEKTLKESKVPVLVDFYAEWCGPCKIAAPIIDKLSGEFKGKMVIAKVNVDEFNQLAAQHGVMSIPTVIVFNPGGEEVDRQIGFPGEDGYRQMIARAMEA